MDLHTIVSGAISQVNAFVPATLRQSTGYTTAADGTQVPSYTETQMMIQVQGLSGDDLKQMDGLNIQGTKNAVYLSGPDWNGAVRVGKQGGDILIFNNQIWLVIQQLEGWPNWVKLAVVLQNGT